MLDSSASEPSAFSDNSRYEQACDQAIAMCDGNLRSTVKALIMANEYLEGELRELQAVVSNALAFSSESLPRTRTGTGPREKSASKQKSAGSDAA